MNNWTLLVLLLVSIIALTAFVTIAVQRRFIGSVTIAAGLQRICAGDKHPSHNNEQWQNLLKLIGVEPLR